MKLEGLKPIYQGMKAQGIERYRFRYQCNQVTFEVFFFIDETPFKLLFGVLGGSFAFDLVVERGFRINPILPDETYYRLCTALGLKYDRNNHFSPLAFFREFNRNIPNNVDKKQKAKAYQIARFYPNIEEADKIYFIGWKQHNGTTGNATPENLEKTRSLLNYKIYKICLNKNISSCWTNDPSRAKNYFVPD